MLNKGVEKFRSGRMNSMDTENSELTIEITTPETFEKIDDMLLGIRRSKVHEIVAAIGISHG